MKGWPRLIVALTALGTIWGSRLLAGAPLRAIDDRDRIVQRGNVQPLIAIGADLGQADPSLAMERIIVPLLIRNDKRAALDRLLAEQQDPSSPNFHRWLTPEEFGARFGASVEEIARVSGWLREHGFVVDRVGRGGTWINLTGTVADVEAAFHTQVHGYLVDGEIHHANATDPSIPAALAGVMAGPVSLHDFRSHSSSRLVRPLTEMSDGAHWLSPADFATVYDIAPLYAAGLNGSGQSIAIVARTNINLDDVTYFRDLFRLPGYRAEVIVNGPDPGIIVAQEPEADLDVEWSGAVAPYADIKLVVSRGTTATDGADLSAQYIVDENLAPVLSTSFGVCESAMGSAKATFYANLWAQAAAQGITAVVASGDSGAAGCNSPSDETGSGLGVNGLASTPSNVGVGGTQFMDITDPGAFWSPANDPTTLASALSYIPEQAWNESGAAVGTGLWATGGGASSVYAKPDWQVAPGVPADGMRDLPDVALTAATKNAYIVIAQRATHPDTFFGAGGTSASAPAFAGLVALIVQMTGTRQGNLNPRLYQLGAAQYGAGGAAVFHDAMTGDNSVPGTVGFACGAGYDPATGLGSVDGAVLASNWLPGGGPDFTLSSVSPSLTVSRGQWVSGGIGIVSSGHLLNPVSLSAAGLPNDMGVDFVPPVVQPQGSTIAGLTVVAADSTPLGTYALTVSGLSGGRIRSCTVTVTVTAAPLQIVGTSTPAATANVPYSFQFGAIGGAGGYWWRVLEGHVPPGLSLAPDGTLSGSPAVAGSFYFRVGVTDRLGATAAADPSAALVVKANSCAGAWRWVNPLPTGNQLRDVTWAGTRFVAVGGGGAILTSPDGVAWTPRDRPTSSWLYRVVWTGSEIVTVSDSILISGDGDHWTFHAGAGTGLAWTGHQLVVISTAGGIATSPDGVNWTPRYSGTTRVTDVAWTGSQAIAIGDGPVLSSSDGEVWHQLSQSPFAGRLVWAGTRLVAVGPHGAIAVSPDGTTWSSPASGTPNNLNALVWTGNLLVAVGESGTILTSPDGAAWTARSSATKLPLYGIAWSGAQFVAVEGSGAVPAVVTSPDGINWTSRATGATGDLLRVRWAGSQLLAIGPNTLLASPDGLTWTSRTLGPGSSLNDVVWTGSQLVGIGTGIAATSPDGITWKVRANGSASQYSGLAWTGRQLIAVGATYPGNGAVILTSPDGITWTERTLNAIPGLSAVCWTGSQLVAVGGGSPTSPYAPLLTSPDGVTWTKHDTELSRALSDVIWTGTQIVALGDVVMTSPDGASWAAYPHSGGALAWTGAKLVSVGSTFSPMGSSEISASPDGTEWTQQSSGTDRALHGVAWTGSRIVAVGDGGTILTSSCLSVCSPPAITFQPEAAAVEWGHPALLAVTATGDGPLLYQWYASTGYGSTSGWSQASTFVTSPLYGPTVFTVTVANAWGSTTSDMVTITVTPSRPRRHLESGK